MDSANWQAQNKELNIEVQRLKAAAKNAAPSKQRISFPPMNQESFRCRADFSSGNGAYQRACTHCHWRVGSTRNLNFSSTPDPEDKKQRQELEERVREFRVEPPVPLAHGQPLEEVRV